MIHRILFPQWRDANRETRYPFADDSRLRNAEGHVIPDGTFADAALYPVGGRPGAYLRLVTVAHDAVTLTVADPTTPVLATGSFPVLAPPAAVRLTDPLGRPAGVLVGEPDRLGVFRAWEVGDHAFLPAETGFAATVYTPTPEAGVRGVLLDDGTLLTGDVFLVGEDGVVLREDVTAVDRGCGAAAYRTVRVDVVGDPLFRRRLCTPSSLFSTPRVVKALRVVWSDGTFTVTPDARGNVTVAANNAEAVDTVLRVRPDRSGLVVEAVGAAAE
mgnify:CR=1 FL=1